MSMSSMSLQSAIRMLLPIPLPKTLPSERRLASPLRIPTPTRQRIRLLTAYSTTTADDLPLMLIPVWSRLPVRSTVKPMERRETLRFEPLPPILLTPIKCSRSQSSTPTSLRFPHRPTAMPRPMQSMKTSRLAPWWVLRLRPATPMRPPTR